MTSASRSLELRFVGDAESALRAMRAVRSELGATETAQDKTAASAQGLGVRWTGAMDSLRGARPQLLAAQAGLLAVAGASIKFAADLGEARSAAEVTFGESTTLIETFAETSARAYGVSNRAAFEYTASLGGMLDASGLAEREAAELSVTMVKLAADVGSLRNVDTGEMFTRIRSGLAGEAEPLRQFGVLLSAARVEAKAAELGLGELNRELTEGEKVQARAAIILQDLAVANGNFAATFDESLPNQIKGARAELEEAAATLGERLLPYALQATTAVTGLVTAFSSMPGAGQDAVVILGALVAGLIALGLILPPLTTAVGTLAGAVTALNVVLAANPLVLAAIAAGLGVAGGALIGYIGLQEFAEDRQRSLNQAVEEHAQALAGDSQAQTDNNAARRAVIAELEREIARKEAAGASTANLRAEVQRLTAEVNASEQGMNAAGDATGWWRAGLSDLQGEMAATGSTTAALAADTADLVAEYDRLRIAAAQALNATSMSDADIADLEASGRGDPADFQRSAMGVRTQAENDRIRREVGLAAQRASADRVRAAERASRAAAGGGGGGGGGAADDDFVSPSTGRTLERERDLIRRAGITASEAHERIAESLRITAERDIAVASAAMDELRNKTLAETEAIAEEIEVRRELTASLASQIAGGSIFQRWGQTDHAAAAAEAVRLAGEVKSLNASIGLDEFGRPLQSGMIGTAHNVQVIVEGSDSGTVAVLDSVVR
jgi:hypothetical protein